MLAQSPQIWRRLELACVRHTPFQLLLVRLLPVSLRHLFRWMRHCFHALLAASQRLGHPQLMSGEAASLLLLSA